MKKSGSIYLFIIIALLTMWIVPRLYYIITAKSYSTPFTLYSCITEDFVSLTDNSGKDFVFTDTHGHEYGDSVLPFFYYRVLNSRNNIPDTINGRQFTGEEIERNNIIFSSTPRDVNTETPNVYMLLESNPPRLELEDAKYAMVSRRDGFKIIEMDDNTFNESLETAFKEALDSVGFRFPASIVSGNPSTRKSYDEGYMLTDADGSLFHLKLADGKPWVERIASNGLSIKHIFITEYENRSSLAYIFDSNNRLYVLDSLRNIIRTDVIADVTKQEVFLVGNILDYTVRVSDTSGEDFWALETSGLKTLKTMRRDYPESDSFDLPKYILPARLALNSPFDTSIMPRFEDFSWVGLGIDVCILAIVVFSVKIFKCRKKDSE